MKSSIENSFSHVYVEEDAWRFPLTRTVLDRFSRSQIIRIGNYKSVFNRSNQDFQSQKLSPKLILAVKREPFLYERPIYSQDFGNPRMFYNTLLLNCIYNCEYCYLQGMFAGANLVAFVNMDSFFEATSAALKTGPLHLAISYDTDLLAFENVIPYCRSWIAFAGEHPDLTIEIRTKSSNIRALDETAARSNVILAWTLSPETVWDKVEHGTAPLDQRLGAVRKAMERGWPVRLCFDPVLRVNGWEDRYRRLFDHVFRSINPLQVHDTSVGVFRMNQEYLKNMQRDRQDSPLLHHPFEVKGSLATYAEHEEMERVIVRQLEKYVPREKIHL